MLAAGAKAKAAANWVMGDLAAHCNNEKVTFAELKLRPKMLGEMIALVEDGE